MLHGVLVIALLAAAWSWLVLPACGFESSVWWPLLASVFLAVVQALVWSPFGLPWLRVLVAGPLLTLLLLAPLSGPPLGISRTALTVFFVALVPASSTAAVVAVARARRGDTPSWEWLPRPARAEHLHEQGRRGRPFASPGQAQVWLEWRRRGVVFPLTV